MAIVINNTPPTYGSVHGDLIFTAFEATKTADPVTYPNYKYVCDIYINGAMAFRAKAFPNPVNKRGVFNIAPIVRNFIKMQLNPSGSGVKVQEFGAGAFYVDVQCKFGEEYSYTTYTNLVIDSSRRYYNHYNSQIYGTQTILGNYTDNIASNRPYVNSLLFTDSNFFVPFFTLSGSISVQVDAFEVPVWEGGYLLDTFGNIIDTPEGDRLLLPGAGYVTASASGTISVTGTSGSLIQLNLSPSAINTANGTPIIDQNTDFYIVTINTNLKLLFYVVDEQVHTPYVIHFMNQLGGFESVSFRKLSRRLYDLQKKTYLQNAYQMDGSGIIYYSNSGGVVNDNVTTYSSQYTQRMKLSTDLLTDQDFRWLRELQFSPIVYLQDGGYKVPVSLVGNNYEELKFVNERQPRAMEIEINFGLPINAQFR